MVADARSAAAARVEACALVSDRLPWLEPDPEELKVGKSYVYRFRAREDGPGVVAKRSRAATIATEHEVYRALERAPVPVLRCFGTGRSARSGTSWLLVEDAGGEPYRPSDPAHRRTAARWLGALHVWAEEAREVQRLPYRGSAYHRDVLADARSAVGAAVDNPATPAAEQPMLDRFSRALDEIQRRSEELRAAARALPPTLVHNGFAGKNVQLRVAGPGPPTVAAFDWEAGGRGRPVADLSAVDPDVYLGVVGPVWPSLDRATLTRGLEVGRIVWHLAPVPGEHASLRGAWPHRALRKLTYYEERITGALRRFDGELVS